MYSPEIKAAIDKTDIIIDMLNPMINIDKKHSIGNRMHPIIKKKLFDDLKIPSTIDPRILTNDYLYYNNKKYDASSLVNFNMSITGDSATSNRRLTKHLIATYGGYEFSFSFIVKKICSILYGISHYNLMYAINKDTSITSLGGYSPRELMTVVGNFIRSPDGMQLSEDYNVKTSGILNSEHWTPITKYIALLMLDYMQTNKKIIISDVRYDDEYQLITHFNIYKIKLLTNIELLNGSSSVKNYYDTNTHLDIYHYDAIISTPDGFSQLGQSR